MSLSAQLFVWQGNLSSDWNTPGNWLPMGTGTFPQLPGDIAVVIPGLNHPRLSTHIGIGTLITTINANIDLNSLTLTVSDGDITSSTIENGKLIHAGTSTLNISGSTFNNIVFDKTGSGVTNFQNGNTFNFSPGNHIQLLPGSGSVNMGVNSGDVFTGSAVFINSSHSILTIGFEGASVFDSDVVLVQDNPIGEIVFGSMGGTSTLTNGALDGLGVFDGILYLGGIIQQNAAVSSIIGNSLLGYPHTLDIENSEFAGDLVAISLGTLSVMSTKMEGSGNYLEAPEITEIKHSVFENAAIKKNITALFDDAWFGGNRYDNCVFVNESNFNIRLNTTDPDTFYNQAAFDNIGSGRLWIASADSCYFDGNITLNNTSANGIIVGNNAAGNLATIAGNIKTTGYNTGTLEFSRIDQMATANNDVLMPSMLRVQNARLRGGFSCIAGTSISVDSSTFNRNNTFTAPDITEVKSSAFSNIAGTATTFTKTGGVNNQWTGDNTFGGVLIVNNSPNLFRMANGVSLPDRFNGNAQFQQINPVGDLIPCSNSNCRFRSNISTEGTMKQITFGGASSGRVLIDGSTAQELKADPVMPPVFRRLTMATTGTGDITLKAPLILRSPGASTFTTGIIRTDATNILFYENVTSIPSGMSDVSHVDGPIRRSGTGNFRFATGNNGKYAPVDIVPTGTFGTFDVQYFNTAFASTTADASLDHVSACEYWDISRPGAGDPVNITLTWDDTRSCGVNDLTSLTAARWNGATWTNLTSTVMGALPAGTITVSGVSGFSPFTLASTNMANPLPIELLYFDARPNGKVVNLHWATATEQNNHFFSIERSQDGLKFEEILRTPGAGNSTERKDYSEVDTRPLAGLSYYRLRQTDYNGETTVSRVVAVRMDGEGKDIRVFPNPADGYFFVETGADPSTLRVRLLNHVGQIVPLAPQVQAGRLMLPTSNLAAGVYYIEIQQNNGVQSRKVIVR